MPIKRGTWPNCVLIAGRDIHVYKVFEVGNKPNKFLPPYMKNVTYRAGEKYTADIGCEGNSITTGFHSYGNLYPAKVMCASLTASNYPHKYKIIECVIPKGSEYVLSLIGSEITSNRIRLLQSL